MKIITTIAIFTIVATLGAVAAASMIPVHEVSASANAKGGYAQGHPNPNPSVYNQGTMHAYSQTPHNQPCSTLCKY
jgi:hypothetical protein